MDPSKQIKRFSSELDVFVKKKKSPGLSASTFLQEYGNCSYFQRIMSDEMMMIARTFCSAGQEPDAWTIRWAQALFQLPQNSDHLLCRELHKISHCSLDTAPSQLFAPCHLSFSASILFFAASHRQSFPPILLIASTFYFSVDTGTDPIPVSSPLTQLLAIHPIIHFSLGVKIIIVINADLFAFSLLPSNLFP